MGAPRQMLAVIESEGVDNLELRLIEMFDADRCESILTDLYDRPSFARWQTKLEKAVRAYAHGDHDRGTLDTRRLHPHSRE